MSKPMRGAREIFSVFGRYIACLLIGLVGTEASILVGGHTEAASVLFPIIAPTVIIGGYGVVGFINRMMDIDLDGWPDPPACLKCRKAARQIEALEKDRDELRDALSTLRLPS